MSNEEKYTEVYITARLLESKVILLSKKSRAIYRWLHITLVLPTILFILANFVLNSYLYNESSVQTIAIAVYYITFLVCYFGGTRSYYHAKILYYTVQEQCGDLSDMIDWTSMRKRQVYKKLDDQIQKPIDCFYEYCQSKQCPFYGGSKRHRLLRNLTLFELIMIMAFSMIQAFGII